MTFDATAKQWPVMQYWVIPKNTIIKVNSVLRIPNNFYISSPKDNVTCARPGETCNYNHSLDMLFLKWIFLTHPVPSKPFDHPWFNLIAFLWAWRVGRRMNIITHLPFGDSAVIPNYYFSNLCQGYLIRTLTVKLPAGEFPKTSRMTSRYWFK